jgi:hypothetical protein
MLVNSNNDKYERKFFVENADDEIGIVIENFAINPKSKKT